MVANLLDRVAIAGVLLATAFAVLRAELVRLPPRSEHLAVMQTGCRINFTAEERARLEEMHRSIRPAFEAELRRRGMRVESER